MRLQFRDDRWGKGLAAILASAGDGLLLAVLVARVELVRGKRSRYRQRRKSEECEFHNRPRLGSKI